MIGDLGEQWLLQRQTAVADPNTNSSRFDEELQEAMLTETRLVFELWSENRSLLDLVNADFTYVNNAWLVTTAWQSKNRISACRSPRRQCVHSPARLG